ncbi:uncharacterized protein LOC105162650 [Sesamum indicum]|uniref:Uncharacterized protein LOC105162650 n=1 Tax=Sesamum indicum TaxID=4182 RepID=A0A6I9T594_SESIN|nr:uncharacterized protein LOC105162650 [Sesamum indicum]
MKFFSELGSCWGGAMVSPAAEAGPQAEVQEGIRCTTRKRLTKVKSSGGASRHWKPNLNSISEDNPLLEANRGGGVNRSSAGVDDRKRPLFRLKSAAKDMRSLSHGEDYWKSCQAMALPAFAPTSFLF